MTRHYSLGSPATTFAPSPNSGFDRFSRGFTDHDDRTQRPAISQDSMR